MRREWASRRAVGSEPATDGPRRSHTDRSRVRAPSAVQLWLLFHSLLVSAPPDAAAAVLASIRGYVEHFFGCADCAAHFLALTAAADDPMPPPSADGAAAVLWLWRAHNKVNLRLNATGERLVLRDLI